MKKLLLPFFSCLLVFTLLLGLFGSARAEVGDDPVVTPVSGDMEFTTEIIPIASLPGIIELDDLMLAPAGFPAGEAQFEGAGVRVTSFDCRQSQCLLHHQRYAIWLGRQSGYVERHQMDAPPHHHHFPRRDSQQHRLRRHCRIRHLCVHQICN